MNELVGYIATGIVSLIVGLILRSLESRPKVVCWQPHFARFEIPEPEVTLQTDAINIQNLGRKSAEGVEVIFKERPDYFQLVPSLKFEEDQTPNGEFLIRLPSLGAKEYFTLHILSYKTPPKIENIRSKSGQGELIPFQMQRAYPLWRNLLSAFLLFVGLGFTLYWLVKVIIFLSESIGIV